MKRVSPEQARAYLQRWSIASAQEVDELRRTPPAQKFRQLEALIAARSLFDDRGSHEEERLALCERWSRIRAAMHG